MLTKDDGIDISNDIDIGNTIEQLFRSLFRRQALSVT